MTSNAATVVVSPDLAISTQPSDINECIGGTNSLTVAVSSGSGTITYQWQSATALAGPYANISGANSATYTPPSTSVGTTYYRVVISAANNGCDAVTSNAVTVVVSPDLVISTQPSDINECIGGTNALTISVSNGSGTITYQWQSATVLAGPYVDFKTNYTYQINEVTKIIEGVDELGIGNGNFVIVGKPAYTFQLTDYLRDDQGRVIVDASTGYPTVDPTIKPFGQTQPKHLLGLNLNINWKDLTFSAVADYRAGAQIWAGVLGTGMDFSGISKRSGQNSRRPFIMPNSSYWDGSKYVENTSIYMVSGGYNFWSQTVNTNANTNYLVSGDFWKIREVSLSYNVPARFFGFAKNTIKGMSVTLSGRNLFMFLPKSNEWTDPEFSNNIGNAQGVSGLDNTPPTRIFGATVNIQL